MVMDPEAILTAEQVAEILQMSEAFVLAEARAGKLVCVRLGRKVRFRYRDVMDYIERMRSDDPFRRTERVRV